MSVPKIRIAIFEDNEIDRFIFERSLKDVSDADYSLFSNPEVGLSYCTHQEFHIVVINLHFWGTNYGYAILDQWASRCISKPTFIATTPYLQVDERTKILESGFDHVFEKPGLYESLTGIIREKILKGSQYLRPH